LCLDGVEVQVGVGVEAERSLFALYAPGIHWQ
jgi:hypothetical protein